MGPSLAVLAFSAQLVGAQLDFKIDARDQVRAGERHTPNTQPANQLAVTDIIVGGIEGHGSFVHNQDLRLRYQPQGMNTWQWPSADGSSNHGRGWTVLHRGTLAYQAGDERDLRVVSTFNLTAGKLDTSLADDLVGGSGLLPGQLGQLIDYTNVNGTVGFIKRVGRAWRFASTETVGFISYPGSSSLNIFADNPGLATEAGAHGSGQSQFKVLSRNQVEYLLDEKQSLALVLELSDVSYPSTSTFLGISPSLAYQRAVSSHTKVMARLGAMKYYSNPYPGIIFAPKWLGVVELTGEHAFHNFGLPKLKASLTVSLLPFYYLQYADIEPRTTVLAQASYGLTRRLQGLLNFRYITMENISFSGYQKLQRGHPKNLMILSLGLRYDYRKFLSVTLGAYGSDRSYEPSGTLSYTKLMEIYGLVGLKGTWQTDRER